MDTTLPPVNNGAAPLPPPPSTNPSSLEVPLSHSGEIIELDLAEMFSPHQSIQDSIDQLDEVVHMLTRERVKPNLWARFIQECWTRGRYATALHYADKGLDGWPLSLLLLHFRIETHSLVSPLSSSYLRTSIRTIPLIPPQSILPPLPIPFSTENPSLNSKNRSSRTPERSSSSREFTRSGSLPWIEAGR